MTYRIRPACEDDLAGIMRIESSCFLPGIRESEGVFRDRLAAFPDGNFVLVPDAETSPIAGYFSSEIWTRTPASEKASYELGHSALSRHDPAGTVLYVSSIAVHPDFRGGAGRILFAESIKEILAAYPGLRRSVFIVNETWTAARHIYETEGFRYTGRLDDFFTPTASPSQAAVIMEKDL
jgi:ribosomal protein S18 acetylase RimI-like enzyme